MGFMVVSCVLVCSLDMNFVGFVLWEDLFWGFDVLFVFKLCFWEVDGGLMGDIGGVFYVVWILLGV